MFYIIFEKCSMFFNINDIFADCENILVYVLKYIEYRNPIFFY